jgi:signal transduction histidine kinase
MTTRLRWLGLAVLTLFAIIGILVRGADHGRILPITGVAVMVAAGVLLVYAGRRLVLPCVVLAAAGVVVLGTGQSSNVGWLAVCVLAAWCVLDGPARAGVLFWAGSLLLFGGEWIWAEPDPGWGAWLAGVTFTVIAVMVVRHQLDLVEQLRAAQAGLAERSRAEERNRIAREVHDVIAHSLTVSLLHLASARISVEYEPAEAADSLAEAERLCRQSLTEVRSTVGLLRQADGAGPGIAPPVPGIADLADLVSGFRLAGADVALLTTGDTGRLTATAGSAVYRIVQEALTNAARHAPGTPVEIRLAVEPADIVVLVDSAGQPGHGTGTGLVSMRERAEALGGTCAAGPGGSGWLVRAVLPLAATAGRDVP